MTNPHANLFWLPKPPSDFSKQCRSLLESTEDLGRRIQALASYSLTENQLSRLAKVIEGARNEGNSLAPLIPFRLGVLSNSTLEFIIPCLVGTAARHGIALECFKSSYGQVVQDAVSPDSNLYRSNPDAVLIAVDFRAFTLRAKLGNTSSAEAVLEAALNYIQTIRAGVKANSKAICILQTLAAPPERLFGSLDRALAGAPRSLIDALNRNIAEQVLGTGDLLLDVAGLAETVGLAEWHSPTQWNMAKLPFSTTFLPLYADHVARIIAALRGKSHRCLILDLDNTLWGGVIGDDGLEGIQCTQGDPTGEAFLSIQRLALDLRERGIVLAVSSKNNDDVARLPFRKHPEMLVREDHIAVFQANWNDKATNIKAIAEELSLGLESMVLLDDNPVERGLVRELLPQVAVPELPSDPALYARTLTAAGYFESVIFSEEDLARANFYQDNARRVALQNQAGDVEAYLASLNMEITFQPFERIGRARIAQLVNKSNQYNLTTRRYTEAEVAALEQDPSCFTLQVRLSDSFGDNGMISVVICRPSSDDVWEIDTWLMSCRVLGRRVEDMVLREVLEHAGRRGIRKLIGVYRPTDRNQLVVDHYAKLGFTHIQAHPDGTTIWELDVATASVQPAPMTVKSIGFEIFATELN
ncbi:MAG: HAD family hydrolase [Acidobacteriaceae bacterium]|nr:HAD family hydrolase [Acidobacteriaceae bacterium]MBV9778940.1 HAD family hydrolase [Acidobacteriaceae bacterium]